MYKLLYHKLHSEVSTCTYCTIYTPLVVLNHKLRYTERDEIAGMLATQTQIKVHMTLSNCGDINFKVPFSALGKTPLSVVGFALL